MTPKRLIFAIFVEFLAVFISDSMIHETWLQSTYKETMSLWRTESEMDARIGWMLLGQLWCAVTFVVIWAGGFAERGRLHWACFYGTVMGLFMQTMTIMLYFMMQPFPGGLAVKWFIAGVLQGLVMGLVVYFAYKPEPAESESTGQPAGSTFV